MSTSLKLELESVTSQAQSIVVDVIISARAELMGEFKRCEHANWDPDEEICTWRRREAMRARDGEGSKEEDKEEPALVAGSPKSKELGDSSKQVKPDAGAKEAAGDAEVQGPVEPVVSQEDITKD